VSARGPDFLVVGAQRSIRSSGSHRSSGPTRRPASSASAAIFPTHLGVNPQHSICAMAWRIAEGLAGARTLGD
jgi:hypothetical protein